jgi:hypothetical protein
MAYTDVPVNSTEKFIVSSPKIKNNFTGIKTLVEVNHGTFDAADEGKHKFVTMPEQVAAPATNPNEMALYTKLNAVTAFSDLFLRSENSGAEFNLTPSVAGHAVNGSEKLPSGLIIKWGKDNVDSGAEKEVTYYSPNADQVINTVYAGFITREGNSGDTAGQFWLKDGSLTATKLSVWNLSGRNANFYYFVVGV